MVLSQEPQAAADTSGGAGAADTTRLAGQVDVTPDSTRMAAAPPPAPTKPPVTPANGRAIKIEGQIQVSANSSTVDSVITWDADLRRMRITALADVTDRLSGSLMADFGNNTATVQDAFLNVKATPISPLSVQVGQFKVPFNGIQLWSDKYGLMIERGTRIRGFPATSTSQFLQDQRLTDRGRGAMLIWKPGRLAFSLGGFLGNGQASDNNAGKEVAARLEYSLLKLPSKDSKPLILGVAAVTNGYYGAPRDTIRVIAGDSLTIHDPQYATAFEGWLEYGKYLNPGLHVAGNVISGQNPVTIHREDGAFEFNRFLGFQGWGEFFIPVQAAFLTGLAPAFRADKFDPDREVDDNGFFLWTPGLNLYFGSTFRAQLNLDVANPEAKALDTESAFRVQTQLLF